MEDSEFERIVNEGIKSVPQEFLDKLQNVAITIEDDPTPYQIKKLQLHHGMTLFGLYEGVPPTKGRGLLPAKITIFKNPILYSARGLDDMREMVKHTVWHEIAHAFGMDERKVRTAEEERRKRTSQS